MTHPSGSRTVGLVILFLHSVHDGSGLGGTGAGTGQGPRGMPYCMVYGLWTMARAGAWGLGLGGTVWSGTGAVRVGGWGQGGYCSGAEHSIAG